MSRKYKFHNKEGIYFISFATVNWVDVFTRDLYFGTMVESLQYCISKKGMNIHAWCLMTNHAHLIFSCKNHNPGDVLRDFKTYTSKMLTRLIKSHPQESRKEWLIAMLKTAGTKNSNVTNYQFWQQHNHPIELWSAYVIDRKIEYIHNNPVVAGFVVEPHFWKYSSAIDFVGGKGLLEIEKL